jgi:hypothetical protein
MQSTSPRLAVPHMPTYVPLVDLDQGQELCWELAGLWHVAQRQPGRDVRSQEPNSTISADELSSLSYFLPNFQNRRSYER